MNFKEIIRTQKTNVSVSTWSNDKLTKKVFPLSLKKGGAFPLTRKWRWALVEFDVDNQGFRLIVAYHVDVPEFRMVLGQSVGSDTRIVARVEYHLNHSQPGWHVHANCDELDQIGVGMVKPLSQSRIPGVHDRHRRVKYTSMGDSMNDNIALNTAVNWFRFPYQTTLGIA